MLQLGVLDSDFFCNQRRKGTQGLIEINNPNLVKSKNLKAKDLDVRVLTELMF